MKRVLALSLVISALCLAGCKDPYGACNKAGQVIATSITQGDNTVLTLAKAGTISPQEAVSILGFLEFANQSDESFLTCAKVAHENGNVVGSYTACGTVFVTQLNNPAELALIRVSNPNAQTQVQAILATLTSALTILQSSLGGS